MPDDLVDRLWSQALREGEGVTGVGRRMAQLVAEECAKVAETPRIMVAGTDRVVDRHMTNALMGRSYDIAETIRDKFCQPPV